MRLVYSHPLCRPSNQQNIHGGRRASYRRTAFEPPSAARGGGRRRPLTFIMAGVISSIDSWSGYGRTVRREMTFSAKNAVAGRDSDLVLCEN